MFDVISFGTATYDVFLRSEGMQVENNDGMKDLCFRLGAKLEVNEIYFDYGGGGTNSAVTFGRQGLNVACCVQVGDDTFGTKIITDLKNERLPAGKAGINTDLVDVRSGTNTDYSTILWAPDGGRTILIYRGKTRLEVGNVPWNKLETKWVYISSLEGNLDIIEKFQSGKPACRQGGVSEFQSKIMWNPGNRELKQREKVLELLPKITVLNVNKEEMEELLAISNKQLAIEGILKKAQELSCEYTVITDDKRGAYLWDKKNAIWYHAGIFEEAPRFETTGAGDAFGSGLATGLIKGLSLEDCLYLASANASSVVGQVGAKKGILKKEDLTEWDKSKLKIEKVNF